MFGVDQVIAAENYDGLPRQSAAAVMTETAGQAPANVLGYRVVHTSGERFVETLAEARALMSELPGARVFCATSASH